MRIPKIPISKIDEQLLRALPYYAEVSLETDSYVAYDRQYEQIGNGNPFATGELIAKLFLYDDSSAPWLNAISKRAYHERLMNIGTLEGRLGLCEVNEPYDANFLASQVRCIIGGTRPNMFRTICTKLKEERFQALWSCVSVKTKMKATSPAIFGVVELKYEAFKCKEDIDLDIMALHLLLPNVYIKWGSGLDIANGVSL